jgi:hypothetical protein
LFLELFSLVQIIIPVVLSDTSVASATLSWALYISLKDVGEVTLLLLLAILFIKS